MKNPTGFNLVSQAIQNNGNPQALVQQIMSNATPEQREGILKQCKSYGVPDDILSKIQNMK